MRRYSLGKRSPASFILRLTRSERVADDDVRARLDERDTRMAGDDRSPSEILLGDPPAHRSALAAKAN